MRLFVAIEIAADIRKKIDAYISKLKPGLHNARWVRPEGLHITLKFLGNVADERRIEIERELTKIVTPKFSLTVRDVGVFPNTKSPRVLWAGLKAGHELGALAESIDQAMTRVGFAAEKRAFTPHVTLARFNERQNKTHLAFLTSEPQPGFGTMTATEFHLYESKLSPQGSRYSKLRTFSLK